MNRHSAIRGHQAALTYGRQMSAQAAGRLKGFTLIEIMIVVAIISIIAMIAFPNYQEFLRKNNRTAAKAALMDIAQRQQQYLLDNREYAPDLPTLGYSLPAEVDKHYNVTMAVGSAPPTFTITATATGGQVVDGNLTLNQAGVKTPASKW